MLNVVFLDRNTLAPQTLVRPLDFPHTLAVFDKTSAEQLPARIADADIVITNKVRLTAEAIAQAPRLKMVAVAATGTDNVDLQACAERGIVVSNIRNYAGHAVPEHVFALIFALRRNLLAYREAVKHGRWQEAGTFCFFDYPIGELHGATLGIVGNGVLGQGAANIGRALGMRVLLAGRKGSAAAEPGYTPFDEVLAQSDVISLHCPLRAETRNLIGVAEFDRMTRRPILINTARGGLVEEQALVAALKAGKISGAGFDVVTQEPPPLDHPFNALLDHPGFILTPHVAWASDVAMQTLADQLIDNIEAWVQGAPRNVVR
ncbi:MAG TPA: D-2-hydroxyacid dehydrogenase [Rhodocyclaceae bacterium]|nr:D-2-hydroxyacid dehydrogenase [Rhodocyclaceae bacterium]